MASPASILSCARAHCCLPSLLRRDGSSLPGRLYYNLHRFFRWHDHDNKLFASWGQLIYAFCLEVGQHLGEEAFDELSNLLIISEAYSIQLISKTSEEVEIGWCEVGEYGG